MVSITATSVEYEHVDEQQPQMSYSFDPAFPYTLRLKFDYSDFPEKSQVTRLTVSESYYIRGIDSMEFRQLFSEPFDENQTEYIIPGHRTTTDEYNDNVSTFTAAYYNESGDIVRIISTYPAFVARGHTAGSFSSAIVPITVTEYPLVDETTLKVMVRENLSLDYPCTILSSGNQHHGEFEWYITCPGHSEMTFYDALAAGYVSGSVSNGYVDAHDQSFTRWEKMTKVTLTPKLAGSYSVRARMKYTDTVRRNVIDVKEAWSESLTFKAYTSSDPSCILHSVEPEEYKYDELDDPLRGMPPFAVKWKDTSAETNPNQIPQKQIIFDFGDEDSGKLNFTSIINTGTTLITPPPQEHLYSAYGPYTCKMTVIDKLGNEATATAQFTPSTAPRLIKTPTLTPLTGNQPLLVEGNAFVAGRPEPTAKWSFELDGNTSGYYEGEKEGKYVEMALLAGGQYSVKCDIIDVSSVVLETTNFTVNVTPDPLYQDNPVKMNNFDVWVYDADGERVDKIQPAFKARYSDTYAHGKAVSFQVPIDYPYIQQLRKDCIFDFGYLGIARRMIVVGYEESDDGLSVTISGKDFVSYVLGYRVATVATRSISGNGKDTQRCSGEALLRYFTIANLNTAARDVPPLHLIGENQDRGGAIEYSARYEKTTDIIDSICTSSGLGWDISLQETSPESIGLRVVEGADRTNTSENPIIFSGREDGLRNAKVGAYCEYTSPNVAIGAGEGSGAVRDYSEFGETSSTGMLRREVFVDAGDSASLEEVRLTCLAKLKNLEDESLSVYPNADAQWRLGIDYHVGDYVTIETRTGILMDMQIVSAEMSYYPEEGEVLLLKCGVDERGTRTILRELELGNTYSKK